MYNFGRGKVDLCVREWGVNAPFPNVEPPLSSPNTLFTES